MKRANLIYLLFLLLVLSACERDDPDFEGPSLDNIYGDFTVLESFDISNRNVDFESGETTVFTAIFSKQVDWEVHVTGLESGAHKVITDFSSELSAGNARWDGSTTMIPLFKEEECAVELRVDAEDYVFYDTLQATSARIIEGFVVADFESGFNSGWTGFVQSGANMTFIITDDISAGQGNSYYDMGGEVNWDYLIGLIDFPATAYGGTTFDILPDPASLYFNVMLNVPEGINNEIVLFQFREDDNQDGSYSEGSEDMFSMELTGLDAGWQLVSIRYADLPTLVNGAPAAPLGDGVYSPDRLSKISVLFLANPVSGYSQTLMDYLIFTEGGPLIP
jgi:hypothetical protein